MDKSVSVNAKRVCFKCSQPGHLANKCKSRPPAGNRTGSDKGAQRGKKAFAARDNRRRSGGNSTRAASKKQAVTSSEERCKQQQLGEDDARRESAALEKEKESSVVPTCVADNSGRGQSSCSSTASCGGAAEEGPGEVQESQEVRPQGPPEIVELPAPPQIFTKWTEIDGRAARAVHGQVSFWYHEYPQSFKQMNPLFVALHTGFCLFLVGMIACFFPVFLWPIYVTVFTGVAFSYIKTVGLSAVSSVTWDWAVRQFIAARRDLKEVVDYIWAMCTIGFFHYSEDCERGTGRNCTCCLRGKSYVRSVLASPHAAMFLPRRLVNSIALVHHLLVQNYVYWELGILSAMFRAWFRLFLCNLSIMVVQFYCNKIVTEPIRGITKLVVMISGNPALAFAHKLLGVALTHEEGIAVLIAVAFLLLIILAFFIFASNHVFKAMCWTQVSVAGDAPCNPFKKGEDLRADVSQNFDLQGGELPVYFVLEKYFLMFLLERKVEVGSYSAFVELCNHKFITLSRDVGEIRDRIVKAATQLGGLNVDKYGVSQGRSTVNIGAAAAVGWARHQNRVLSGWCHDF